MHENKRIQREFLGSLLVFLAAVFLFVGFIVLLCIFGGEIMRMFGFTYRSTRSLLIFFIFGAVISWPISLAAEAIPNVLCFYKCVINKWQAVLVYLVLATLATAVGLSVMNAHMTGVVANRTSIVVVSFLLAICNCGSIIIDRPEET